MRSTGRIGGATGEFCMCSRVLHHHVFCIAGPAKLQNSKGQVLPDFLSPLLPLRSAMIAMAWP
jgi:hypothetical protein